MKKILCATDGSHTAEKAVGFAARLAKDLKAELCFVTISTVSSESASQTYFWDAQVLEAGDLMEQTELLTAVAAAKKAGVEGATYVVAYGRDIPAAIVDYAEKHGYDHIVMGSSGRTGVSRMVLGSVAGGVVAKAHCPVTVVR